MKGRLLALGAMLVLSGCVVQPQQPEQPPSQIPPPSQPSKPIPPAKTSSSPITPQPSAAPTAKRPTQFAPPPGGKGRWDASLGVYVIQGQKDLYYRQRTYYHWDSGWYWGVGPQGPWTETDSSGVPPGLTRKYAQ
ncbi:hypothetical protein IB260_07825 [Pseudomonas sp. PDM23]|uniref:hypothetical protein n=1 Tax=unclassified Pseudomonas TaxID=196821 RepID=UPI001781EDAF|nr:MULTISPECIES: hypothetical protein [unclassified Pseudomonas]MBD9500094.1 hypothetical protein [Pseudomonas sp. PDM17]MBD9575212.1 hypothetical protein [Pseudomonas sp. PDM23]MBD9669846.1 hypothetical protein [Pseudomonas sp. PDM21]